MNVWDLLVKIRGDSGQFREDLEQDKATLDALFGMLNDKDLKINLDDADAVAKVDELKLKLDDFLNKTVDLKISDEKAKREIDEFKRKVKDLKNTTVDIKLDDATAKHEVETFKRKLDELHDHWVKLHVENAGADIAIDHTKEKLDTMHDKHVVVDVDTRNSANKLRDVNQQGAGLVHWILAFLPLASPLAADLAGGIGGLASAFTAAGLGAVGFGAVADYNIKQVSASQKTLQADIANVNAAQKAVSHAKTYQQWLQATLQLQAAHRQLATDEAKIGPATMGAVNALNEFESFWKRFATSFQPLVFKGFEEGLKLLEKILTDMRPAIEGAGKAIDGLIHSMNKNMDSAPVKQFFEWVGKEAGPMLTNLGRTAGYWLEGFMNLMRAFSPLAQSMTGGLANMAQRWEKWTAGLAGSDKFKQLIAYVQQTGPVLLDVLKQAIDLLTNFLVAMAPIGKVMLEAIDGILRWINGLTEAHPWILTVIGVILQLIGIFKLLAPVIRVIWTFFRDDFIPILEAVWNVISKVGVVFRWLWGVIQVVGEAIGVAIAAIGEVLALPEEAIAALVAAVALGVGWIIYHWNEVKTNTMTVFHAVMKFLGGIQHDIGKWLGDVASSIGTFFSNLWNSITSGLSRAGSAISSWASNAFHAITGEFDKLGGYFSNLWQDAVKWGENLVKMIGSGISNGVHYVEGAVNGVIGKIKNFLGFGSPTKEGPGATSDRWMPNLMNMLSKGIEDGTPLVQASLNKVFVSPSVSGMMSNARAYGASIAHGISGGLTVHAPMTVQGNVYGMDDLQGMMNAHLQSNILPVMKNLLQQPARSMGIKPV